MSAFFPDVPPRETLTPEEKTRLAPFIWRGFEYPVCWFSPDWSK